MENIELRRMLEIFEEGKRHMCLQLKHVLEEQVGESSTLVTEKETSKVKPICGYVSNIVYGPYEENYACAFFQHLQDSDHMHVCKSGWLESSANSSSSSKAKNMGGKFKEVIRIL